MIFIFSKFNKTVNFFNISKSKDTLFESLSPWKLTFHDQLASSLVLAVSAGSVSQKDDRQVGVMLCRRFAPPFC